jgi:hypothetical protein
MLVVVADADDNDVTVPHVRRAVLEAGQVRLTATRDQPTSGSAAEPTTREFRVAGNRVPVQEAAPSSGAAPVTSARSTNKPLPGASAGPHSPIPPGLSLGLARASARTTVQEVHVSTLRRRRGPEDGPSVERWRAVDYVVRGGPQGERLQPRQRGLVQPCDQRRAAVTNVGCLAPPGRPAAHRAGERIGQGPGRNTGWIRGGGR